MNDTSTNLPEPGPAGGFDPGRAGRLRSQAQEAFLGRYRKAARVTWGYLLGCMLAGWWCVRRFLAADDMRSWIVWGVLCLLAFETTVLIKLWYWVVNNKLSVLRELKLLRLDLALQKGSEEALEDIARVDHSTTKLPGIGKMEQYAWSAAVIAVGLLIGAELGKHADRYYHDLGQMTSECRIQLASDGAARIDASYELANSTSRTLKDFTIYSGGIIPKALQISPADSDWSDAQGRKLAVRREPDPNGPNRRDVIQLLDPVPPGQRFTLNTSFTWAARQENGLWVFKLDQNWGYRRNLYRETVILPAGAELISADPAPLWREQHDGATLLRFEGERGANAKWAPVLKYRLPGQ